jgi:branched-subunit amino acid aminotransferase/4-amino-4-deoxychorismate lyase
MKAEKIWMDGKLVDWDEAKVHVCTHALHYGSGIFEGICLIQQRYLKWKFPILKKNSGRQSKILLKQINLKVVIFGL